MPLSRSAEHIVIDVIAEWAVIRSNEAVLMLKQSDDDANAHATRGDLARRIVSALRAEGADLDVPRSA
jgi:hypothetical protein